MQNLLRVLKVGDRIQMWGRVQSREYEKKHEDGESIKKVAYEVSISKIKKNVRKIIIFNIFTM